MRPAFATLLLLAAWHRAEASAITMADFSAAATTLDFETLSSGEAVSSQFAAAGVSVYGIGIGGDLDGSAVYAGLIALTISDFHQTGPFSGSIGPFRVVATTAAGAPDQVPSNAGVIGAQFIDPITGNAATTTKAGAWFYNHSWGPASTAYGELSAFGVDGGLLGTVKLFGGALPGGYQFIGIGIDGIHRVEFQTGYSDGIRGPDGFNVDDLIFEPLFDTGLAPSFQPPAPVPDVGSSVLLFMLGIGAVLRLAARRASPVNRTRRSANLRHRPRRPGQPALPATSS